MLELWPASQKGWQTPGGRGQPPADIGKNKKYADKGAETDMIKWIFRIFLVGVLVFFLLGVYAYINLKATQPPAIKDAPYAIQLYYETGGVRIPTRYYYAKEIEINSANAVLTNYWRYDGARYYKINDEKVVEPPFDIIRRVR